LALSQRIVLTVHHRSGIVTIEAEVRWMSRVGEHYLHGLFVL